MLISFMKKNASRNFQKTFSSPNIDFGNFQLVGMSRQTLTEAGMVQHKIERQKLFSKMNCSEHRKFLEKRQP